MTQSSPGTSATRVKVCGIREPSEAAALDALGVDWIGFNFHPASPRYIAPEAAAPIIRSLKRSVPVGVFVDVPAARIAQVAAITGIRMIQLHGSEDWDAIRAMPLPVIKALPHTRLADLGGLRPGLQAPAAVGAEPAAGAAAPASRGPGSASHGPLAYLLVDTQAKASAGEAGFGGSGQVFDWGLLAAHPLPLPLFLAGGLGPGNLAAAVAATAPFAVDLNSKVEISPGRKDLEKIRTCLSLLGRIPS